ncbi:hypothetical protein B0H13DRAFT_1933772 [Mycena leptocephala]|nr:hypothetical protein B0H13DRAFT_1933772 [Mycena leptocephala]
MALAKRTDFTCPNTDLAGNPLLAATLTSNDGGVTLPGQPDVPGLGICQYGSGFCDYDPESQCLSFFQRYPIINVAIFGWTIQRAHLTYWLYHAFPGYLSATSRRARQSIILLESVRLSGDEALRRIRH